MAYPGAEEFRIDPSDGGLYTYEQTFAFYQGRYAPPQIGAYWMNTMIPLKGKGGKGKDGKGAKNRGMQNQQKQRQQREPTQEEIARYMKMLQRPPEPTEEELEQFRGNLRFGLNDRVLCNCGDRWLSGHIVGSAVPDDDDILPYLVKTDNRPGLPSSTISVPFDEDEVCVQEVCFEPSSLPELRLIKAATAIVNESSRPKLRFSTGDNIVCRIRNDPNDGLEQWVPGVIDMTWAEIPGERTWSMADMTGEYADVVPYKVSLKSGRSVFCHRDDHTLIRREGMQPQERVKGISKRMELRRREDGSKEKIDHVTERRKVLEEVSESDSD